MTTNAYPPTGTLVNGQHESVGIETYHLTPIEADIIDLWREEMSLLHAAPVGFEFSIDANADRMVSKFYQKNVTRPNLDRRGRKGGNGNH